MAEELHNLFLRISHIDLNTELTQLSDEGKWIPPSINAAFNRLQKLDHDELYAPAGQAKAFELLDKTAALPVAEDFPFVEPSDLQGIRRQRPRGPRGVRLQTIRDTLLSE
jgi:hypothetical protein